MPNGYGNPAVVKSLEPSHCLHLTRKGRGIDMFELRVYVGANPPILTTHVNAMVPLMNLAKQSAGEGGFSFTRAECWYNGIRQWELMVD